MNFVELGRVPKIIIGVIFFSGIFLSAGQPAFPFQESDTTAQIKQLVKTGDFQKARQMIVADQKILSNWRDTEVIGCWAVVLSQTDSMFAAWPVLDEIFRRTGEFAYDYLDTPPSHTLLGYYHLTHHTYRKGKSIAAGLAAENFEKALRMDHTAKLHHGLAMAYLQMARGFDSPSLIQKAIENEEAAIALSDTDWSLFHGMGEIYASSGDVNNATKFYSRSIELNPQNFVTYYEMGTAYMNAGYLDSALAAYGAVLSIKPAAQDQAVYRGLSEGVFYQMASLHAVKGQVQRVIDTLRTAKTQGFYYPPIRIRRDQHFSGILLDQQFLDFLNREYVR